MAEVNGTDHLVRHEKGSKLNGYDNEGYLCQERSEDEEESASDDDRLRAVVTENGHRPEDDSHISNGYVHDDTNGHSTTVNGSAVIVIEESNSNMNDIKEDSSSQKPLDTRLHHYVPIDDIDRKILNGSDGIHVTIPEDAVINFTTGRVKVKKSSSNNSQVSTERESIPLETMLPSYEAEDKIGLGEKAELEAELTNHKNGLWSEGHNTYNNAESPFGKSEKLNGTSKSSDEIALPVNNHRKCLRGEKLYFTEENRKLCPGWRRVFVCGLILIIIAVALLLGVLAATGILLAESDSKNSRYESGHSLPSSDFISSAGHSYNRPRPPFKVPQKSSEDANTTDDPVSRTSSPAVSSKVPVLNDSSHSQTIVPNALVGEFTIDENFTDDLKDSSSSGYQSLAKFIERELHGIFKRNGGVFETLKILSFSPGSIKIKFVTIWVSDRNVILSTKAEEIFKSFLKKNRNSLLAYPVELDSIRFIDVFDECRVQKGGCSFNCIWDYSTLSKTCACGENMVLLTDGKSCGPKPSTSALETTTPKSINTTATTTDQSLIKESSETTETQDRTTRSTTEIPNIVTKAIISITELFHNLTSTEISAHVTESTINVKNLSTIVTEYFPPDVKTTTESYPSEQPATTGRTANTIPSSGIQNETTPEITTIADSSNNENTENDNIFNGSDITDANIHSNESATPSSSILENETTSSSISEHDTTATFTSEHATTSSSISKHDTTTTSISEHETSLTSIPEHETVTPSLIVYTNDSVDSSDKTTSTPENTDSHFETTTNTPITQHATTQRDLTTIGYHIKEETTEMYTLKDNTEFETIPEFDTSTEEPVTFITDVEVTANTFYPNHITESTITTELTPSPALDMTKNASEVMDYNATTVSDVTKNFNATNVSDIIHTSSTSKDSETTVNPNEENVTYATESVSVTEVSNEEFLNKSPVNFTSPDDDLNETKIKDPNEMDYFETTTFQPLTTTRKTNRPPEVRSFDDDDENETTTQNISLENTHNFMNDSSTETDKQTDKNDTTSIVDSTATFLPTSETPTETTLFETTTKQSENSKTTTHFIPVKNELFTSTENYETTTHFIPVKNELFTSIEKTSFETTVVPENIPENTETTVNMDVTTTLTTESPHINNNPNVMNGVLDTTTAVLEAETTTVQPTEGEITTILPTETSNGIIETNNSTEPDNVTLEYNTENNVSSTSIDTLENATAHTSNDSETTEQLLQDEETTTSSYNETTVPDILETILPNNESNIHTFSTNDTMFNSSTTPNDTSDEFFLHTTLEPMNITDDVTTEDTNKLDDSDLTSLETSNFSISNTELPSNVTPTLSSDSNETFTSATVPDYVFPTPPYHNGSEVEVTTESNYDTENMFTFAGYDNETLFPFDMDSNSTNTTDLPFESSFLEINSTFIDGENESMANTTFLSEFDNFTTESYDAANETTTNASTGIECKEDQFLCEPLNRCINDTFMCDGILDCPDGNDEFQCKDTCHSNFRCANSSTCIMSEAHCDGIWDCENGTDEENCSPAECAQHEVMCSDHSKCIKPADICDWKYNCLDRSDEVGCVERTTCESNGRFFCNDGLCIPWSLKCDGEYDCKEGEDEGNCTCLSDEFQCSDGKCLKSSSRCDGHQDCHDADDEMGCVTVDKLNQVVSTYEPYSGTWGLLCAEDWNLDDGHFLCQELGFGHALNVDRVHVSFNGTWMAMKRENLTDTSLWTERVAFVESCTSGLAATVECQPFDCGEYSSILHRRRRDVISSSSQWPFIGYTSTFQSNRGCLSEILTPIWLITSAECLLSISKEPFNGSDWYVRTNIGRDVEADLAQNHEVLKIINHPHSSKFRSLTLRDYDVALIRLKHALVFVKDKLGAICLPEEKVPAGITCFSGVLGTEKPRAPPPPVLTINNLALQITDRRNCNRVEHYNNAINERMLCTQSSESHSICDNDEGTPLICLSGINNYFLAGMLTYQRFCDVYSKHPAVFSNLFSMRKFLDQVTGQKQYNVSYDSNMYIIVPPTTPSPTMPETTTPELTTLGTTEFALTNSTYLTTTEFENGTETIFDNFEEMNATTEVDEELAREGNYTTVLPEELLGLLSNATLSEDYWNETLTTPYETDTDVLNATLEELEKPAGEFSDNGTHDDLISFINDTYSSDGTLNDTALSVLDKEFSNVTTSTISEIETVSLESTNHSAALELNDSLITTEFTISDNETTIATTEMSVAITETIINTTDATSDATATVQPFLISSTNDSSEYSNITTPTFNIENTTNPVSIFNGTVEMFKSKPAQANESELFNQPLLSLIDGTNKLENLTTMSSLTIIDSNTENISTDSTFNEAENYTHHVDVDSETTVNSMMNVTDSETPVETTTQPMEEEMEAVTFVVEGEPDADLAFSLFKQPEGLKIESYRMLEDNDFNPKENLSSPTKQDVNISFTTEDESTVVTTIFPEHFTNETEKRDVMFDNVTDRFNTESISPTTVLSMNLTSEAETQPDTANAYISSFSNMAESINLEPETLNDEVIPKSENLVNNSINHTVSLAYEDGYTFDITNKSSLFSSRDAENHDLIFHNITEKTIPKSAGLIMDDMNYSVPLSFEDHPKSNFEDASSLIYPNDTEKHSIYYNVTDQIIPKLIDTITDNLNDSVHSALEDSSKSSIENTSLFPFEKPVLNFNNESREFGPRSFDSIKDDVNYSAPLPVKDDTMTDILNPSVFPSDVTEKPTFEFYNDSKEFISRSFDSITEGMNYSAPLTLKDDTMTDMLTTTVFPSDITEKPAFEFYNDSEEFMPRSFDSFTEDMNYSAPRTLIDEAKTDNINKSLLSFDDVTEDSAFEFDNKTEDFVSKSENPIIDEGNSMILTLESENANSSTLNPQNLTGNRDFIFDKKPEEFPITSESLVKDSMNRPVHSAVENDNTNTPLLSNTFYMTEEHEPVAENVTEKNVPKLIASITEFAPKSESLVRGDMNQSVHLVLENDNTNASSLLNSFDITEEHELVTEKITEEHELVTEKITEENIPKSIGSITEFTPKSEVSDRNDMNQSVHLVVESDDTNASSLLNTFNITEEHGLETENITEKNIPKSIISIMGFAPKSEGSIRDDVNQPIHLVVENENTNASSLSNTFNMTEDHEFLTENITEKNIPKSIISIMGFAPKSDDSIRDDVNQSVHLVVENDNTNASSISNTFNMTEEREPVAENVTEKNVPKSIIPFMGFAPKSEGSIRDDVNQSVHLVVENDNTNASSLSNTFNMTEHELVTENITEKNIPRLIGSNVGSTINFPVPSFFDKDKRWNIVNESSVDDHNKTIEEILEPELDVSSMEDSIMRMHLTSEELSVFPEINTVPNLTDCGVWDENSYAADFDNQYPFKLWPAIGYLERISGSKKCSATVISPKYVITSLDCLKLSYIDMDLDPSKWTYVGGLYDSEALNKTQTLTVNKIISYPEKSFVLQEHDVALIKINNAINMNEYSKSSCIVQQEIEPGKECFTAGWNKNFSDGDIQSLFYSFPITMISTEECNNTMNYNGELIDNLLCGFRGKETKRSCYMESGSPLFCLNENKHWELHGILNQPDPCDTTKPIVFTDILSVKKWIDETLSNDDIILDIN